MACIIIYDGQEFTEAGFAKYFKDNRSKFIKDPKDVTLKIDRSLPGGATAEQKFMSEYKGAYSTVTATYTGSFSKAGEGTDRLVELNKDVKLDTTDPKNTFYTKAGIVLFRVTNYITEHFSSTEKSERVNAKTPWEWAANRFYRSRGINTNESIKYENGQTYTHQELVDHLEQQFKENAINGSIVHAIIESYIKPHDPAVKQKLTDLYAQTTAGPKKFGWINREETVADLLINTLGLNVGPRFETHDLKDRTTSELSIGSVLLKIGTTIDLLVEHANNSFSLIDFKTGSNFTNDQYSPEYMKYTETVEDIIRDSKLDKAKMELMLRAFIIKEQMPEARFRDLKVVHLNKNAPIQVYEVGMDSYLKAIEAYYKAQDPALHAQLKARGMFQFANYTTTSGTADMLMAKPEFQNKDLNQVVATAQAKVRQIQERFESQGKPIPLAEQREINELTAFVLETSKTSHSVDFGSKVSDIGLLDRWFGTKYDMSHPILATYLQLFEDRQQAVNVKFEKLKMEQARHIDALKEEYFNKFPEKKLGNVTSLSSIKYHDPTNEDGFFDFMWELKERGDTKGYYARIITRDDVDAGKYTEAQYEYNKWYRSTLKDLWRPMNREAFNGKTAGELIMGNNLPFDEHFMPRYPKGAEEFREQHGTFSKKSIRSFLRNQLDMFIEQQQTGQDRNIGIPVKYIGAPSIIAGEFHTFNAEQAMIAFAENMIRKDLMDDVYALGKGTITMLSEQKGKAGENLPRTIEWLTDYLQGQLISNRDAPVDMYRKTRETQIRIPYTNQNFKWNYSRSLESVNNGVTASIMWLNPQNAGFNAVQILLYNAKEALVGEILKALGSDYNYSFADFQASIREYMKSGVLGKLSYQAKGGSGKFEDNDKMHGFIRLLRYDTKTFKTMMGKSDIRTAKNTLMDKDNLFLLHTLGEEFGLYTNMIALLKAKKLRDGTGRWIKVEADGTHTPVSSKKEASSMWDAYEMKDGTLTYRGPQRGVLADGTPLTELTANEIAGLKRVSQRINGSYREDEKCAAELHIWGRYLMKFKKYLPSLIANNFQRRFDDWSLGEYREVYDAEGNPVIKDGQQVYDWQVMVNEGRVRVALKFLIYYCGVKFKDDPRFASYQWSKMSKEQQRQVIDAGVAVFMYGLLAAAGFRYYDDDDKKTKGYRKFLALQENMIQVLPVDLLRTTSSPLIQFKMLSDLVDAMGKFFFDGVIMGDVVQTGPNRGEMVGWATLESKVPVLNFIDHYDEAQDLFGDEEL